MYISRLALDHFRSWEQCLLDFAPGITIIYGDNGRGKTNIVEAIEFLSSGMSHRTHTAKTLIQAGQASAHIRANVVFNDSDQDATDIADQDESTSADAQTQDVTTFSVTLSTRGAHRARVNNGNSQYLRDIIGKVPTVTFAPEDQLLVSSEPGMRRHFLDAAAVFLVPGYYELLQRYNHIAKQRVALLKNVASLRSRMSLSGENVDMSQVFSGLEIWTNQLVDAGIAITKARLKVVQALAEPFSRIYRRIAGERNTADITYAASYEEFIADETQAYAAIIDHYQRLFEGEVAQARNLIGPHRDDFSFILNGMNAKEYASNGEMWSLSLALKMALFEVLTRFEEHQPILILDDVFAQLDNSRRSQIISFAASLPQVFITVAAKSDVPEELLHANVHFIDVESLRAQEKLLTETPSLSDFLNE
ncbi:DNA replication/repair protein RecF [Alloscardovia criceti]|uniref:DNA replication/repair protein RecF n=1 Tax=Alloscardovia criceti TaxID=356828 RepID=UPI00035E91F8|nr:DNA replication/repair protein RecF [Alloscardovia criceti]